MAEEERAVETQRSEPDLPEVVLIQVRTGMWQGTAPIKYEDLGLDEVRFPKTLFKLGQKRLYPEEIKSKFTGIGQKAGVYLGKKGVSFLLKNTYVIPRLKLPQVYKDLKVLEGEYAVETENFLASYEKIREDWLNENWQHRDKLIAHYPEKEELRKQFKFRIIPFEIRGINAKEADEEVLLETVEEARKDFEGLCANMVGECIEVLRVKVAKTIKNLTDRIRSGKIIRNDTLESVKNIHEQFKELNIFGDTNIENSLMKLRQMLDNVADAAFLKDNTKLQNEILEAADAVSSQAEDLTDVAGMTGRYKRLIDMD